MKRLFDFESLIDLIYRQKKICYICGEYNPFIEKNLCGKCRSRYSLYDKDICSICGRKIELEENAIGKEHSCFQCISNRNIYDGGIAVFNYSKNIKKLIAEFKYEEELYLKEFFAYEMANRIKSTDIYQDIDFIISVPMSINRLKTRGYNQADILAELVSKFLNIPYEDSLLKKIDKEKSQKGLSRIQRIRNIKDSFIINKGRDEDIYKKNILIIDDVYTTGTTVNEISRVLKKKNADKVYFLTLASTPFNV
ncbi:MAG: ComF family protein [Andreesenia angusta]|nr:ComF family protein [Andreesenia angusta]